MTISIVLLRAFVRSRFDREIALSHPRRPTRTARLIDADPFAPRPWLATEHVA